MALEKGRAEDRHMTKVFPITNGRRYPSFAEAKVDAELQFHTLFPLADPKYGILVCDHGDGTGFLQASRRTAAGGFVSEVEFKDFRPIRRVESEEAKVSYFL